MHASDTHKVAEAALALSSIVGKRMGASVLLEYRDLKDALSARIELTLHLGAPAITQNTELTWGVEDAAVTVRCHELQWCHDGHTRGVGFLRLGRDVEFMGPLPPNLVQA